MGTPGQGGGVQLGAGVGVSRARPLGALPAFPRDDESPQYQVEVHAERSSFRQVLELLQPEIVIYFTFKFLKIKEKEIPLLVKQI